MRRDVKDALIAAAMFAAAIVLAAVLLSLLCCDDGDTADGESTNSGDADSDEQCAHIDCPPDTCDFFNGSEILTDYTDATIDDDSQGQCACIPEIIQCADGESCYVDESGNGICG